MKIHFTAIVLLACASAALADPTQSMRCGTRLVGEGDHPARVAALCGKPDYVEERRIYREGIARRNTAVNGPWNSPSHRELQLHRRSVVEVPVQVWVYNFGPRRLMRELTFEEGRLVGLESLGYGY